MISKILFILIGIALICSLVPYGLILKELLPYANLWLTSGVYSLFGYEISMSTPLAVVLLLLAIVLLIIGTSPLIHSFKRKKK